jgi:7-carboxy-7-deazaguanine synthase
LNTGGTDNAGTESTEHGDLRGYVSEIFCSVQGEGPYVGENQIFFRTAGCRETCGWCDTLYSKVRPRTCSVTPAEGGGSHTVASPMTVDTAIGELLKVARNNPQAQVVSITGGEPLEQAAFVCAVAARLKEAGKRVYLETNGLHDGALSEVLPHIDVVAMDIKLPSAVRKPLWEKHRAFLSRLENTPFIEAAHTGSNGLKSVFVKVVIDGSSLLEEVDKAATLVASTSRNIPLVLQPESSLLLAQSAVGNDTRRLNETLADFYKVAAAKLENVRVMPQVHRLLNIR